MRAFLFQYPLSVECYLWNETELLFLFVIFNLREGRKIQNNKRSILFFKIYSSKKNVNI